MATATATLSERVFAGRPASAGSRGRARGLVPAQLRVARARDLTHWVDNAPCVSTGNRHARRDCCVTYGGRVPGVSRQENTAFWRSVISELLVVDDEDVVQDHRATRTLPSDAHGFFEHPDRQFPRFAFALAPMERYDDDEVDLFAWISKFLATFFDLRGARGSLSSSRFQKINLECAQSIDHLLHEGYLRLTRFQRPVALHVRFHIPYLRVTGMYEFPLPLHREFLSSVRRAVDQIQNEYNRGQREFTACFSCPNGADEVVMFRVLVSSLSLGAPWQRQLRFIFLQHICRFQRRGITHTHTPASRLSDPQ